MSDVTRFATDLRDRLEAYEQLPDLLPKITAALEACGLEVSPKGTGEAVQFLDGARIRKWGRNKALIPQFDLVWPERLEHDAAEKLLEQFTARRSSLSQKGEG